MSPSIIQEYENRLNFFKMAKNSDKIFYTDYNVILYNNLFDFEIT